MNAQNIPAHTHTHTHTYEQARASVIESYVLTLYKR